MGGSQSDVYLLMEIPIEGFRFKMHINRTVNSSISLFVLWWTRKQNSAKLAIKRRSHILISGHCCILFPIALQSAPKKWWTKTIHGFVSNWTNTFQHRICNWKINKDKESPSAKFKCKIYLNSWIRTFDTFLPIQNEWTRQMRKARLVFDLSSKIYPKSYSKLK